MLFPICTFPLLWTCVSFKYRERFLRLAVVLRESGMLKNDGCDAESEEEDNREKEESVCLGPRDESLYLLQDVDVEGSDSVGLHALVSAALMAVSSAACCAAMNG